ncbi:FAD-dependent oxidoreductase [Thiohalomonas denitrificans]|uniref:FAD-dependent oxidoreductase n=1 Tax=Thiohalomonas denitrificans TaxID=415747 RepID=UPI0026EDFD4C|nr:FAD-dependent oxidoreductase [Thiohalomonas denitrificans]
MSEKPTRIVVVGGVAAGMSAAARARRLDEHAQIIVFEKDRYVSFANCGLPYHISGDIRDREELLVVTPDDLSRRLNLEVYTEHEVIRIDRVAKTVKVTDQRNDSVLKEHYDKLILATGATPLRPAMPGVDHPYIFTLRNIPDMDAIKATVDAGVFSAIVVGGGYIGVEMAEALRRRGLRVDLVEQSDQIMTSLDPEMSRDLAYHMESYGVHVTLGKGVREFRGEDGRVEVRLDEDDVRFADMAILAVGVRPEVKLAKEAGLEIGRCGGIRVDEHMRTSDPSIYAAGDAVEVRDAITGEWTLMPLAGPANRQGRIAADHIFGRESRYRSSQGSSILKVFDMTGGGTGVSEKSLRRAGIHYRKVYVHPNGHAAYYPGTHPMHLKLLFRADSGHLLGAQAVGFDGVDKRIDVLATAIHAGMTVYDLEELELSYAPPYGSAKDPVNIAGFVAANLLRGDVKPWYAEEWPALVEQGGVLVDLRTPKEFASWNIPGAINIPIGELRGRIGELDAYRDRGLYLYCLSGFRSYLGVRQLTQNGFERVYNLSGGVKTFMAYHHNPLASGRPGGPWISYAEDRAGGPGISVV